MTLNTSHAQIRPATQAGRFYEADRTKLQAELNQYFEENKEQPTQDNVAALIVPHAGYYFSGHVAAAAYARLDPGHIYERVFLLGPSHHEWLDGASVNNAFSAYSTPLGRVPVELATANKIIQADPVFFYNPKAHDREHCLEVQLPFLQTRLEKMPPIVPIIISTNKLDDLKRMARVLKPYLNDPANLFVISSDFSHYPSRDDARRIDSLTAEAVTSGKADRFIRQLQLNAEAGVPNLQTSACGEFAIITLLEMLDEHFTVSHIAYQNSGDIDNYEPQHVVGYNAFVISRKAQGFSLTAKEKAALKALARESIASRFDKRECELPELTDALKTPCGAFVTLTEGGHLRGCIGHIGEDIPLYEVVRVMARQAAFEDPRFSPLTRDELDKVHVEISVLTPMKRIHGLDDFVMGRDGLLIRKGYRSGTFLPQVADEVNWTKEEFFGHCSQDKAGLGWNGWRDADLYTYQAIVF